MVKSMNTLKNIFSELKTQLLSRNPVVLIPLLLITTLLLFGITFLREPNLPPPIPAPSSKEILPNSPPKLTYPKDKIDKMLNMVDNRTPLTTSDQAIRNRIIASIGSSSGTLFETPRYTIEYVQAPDSFMVEVKTIDIQQVKSDAVKWFTDQGVSTEGTCYFPIVFHSTIPLDVLPPTPLIFNPIPEGC